MAVGSEHCVFVADTRGMPTDLGEEFHYWQVSNSTARPQLIEDKDPGNRDGGDIYTFNTDFVRVGRGVAGLRRNS